LTALREGCSCAITRSGDQIWQLNRKSVSDARATTATRTVATLSIWWRAQ
jgi:hypothetical protein